MACKRFQFWSSSLTGVGGLALAGVIGATKGRPLTGCPIGAGDDVWSVLAGSGDAAAGRLADGKFVAAWRNRSGSAWVGAASLA